jgi:hypothetical protein
MEYQILMPDVDVMADAFAAEAGDIVKNMQTALTKSAIEVQGVARTQAPTRTGRLVNSIMFKVLGMTAVIAPTVPYGVYVERGTGLYGPRGTRIVSPTGGVMAWKGNGGMIFAMSTKGQHPNPFMKRTALLAPDIIEKYFKITALGVVEDLSKA